MNISALQDRSVFGIYPQISNSKSTVAKTNNDKKNTNENSASSKSKGFSWSDLWDIIADISSIIAGRKTIKGTMSAIKSAYEKIKKWF